MQTMKQSLKVSQSSGLSLSSRLCDFLLMYRSSVHATTGVTPNSLFLKTVDLLRPDPEARVLEKQYQQKTGHDQRARNRQFSVGDSVMAKNFHSGSSWVPGTIVSKLGPLSYLIETDDSQVKTCGPLEEQISS